MAGHHLGGGGGRVCADALGGLPCSGCAPAALKASAKAETLMGAVALPLTEDLWGNAA